MSIVKHLPCSAMVGEPFADYLNFSVPLDSAGGLLDGVLGILYEIGSFEETQDGVFRHLHPCIRSGKVVVESLGSVRLAAWKSASCFDVRRRSAASPRERAVP